MVDRERLAAAVVNAVRSAGVAVCAWSVDGETLLLLLPRGYVVSFPLSELAAMSPNRIVSEFLAQAPPDALTQVVRPIEDIVQFPPEQVARLRFLRWLVTTGRLEGDTAPDPARSTPATNRSAR